MPNSISTGVAYSDPSFVSLNVTGATTLDGSVALGNAAADIVGAHGAAGSAQAAICSAPVTGVTAGAASSADYQTLVAAVLAMRTLLINKGFMAAS